MVVCADDFAQNEAITRSIFLLAGAARISATSAMVLSPQWPADAALLNEFRARIDVGLHLDWTSLFARASGHGASLLEVMIRARAGALRAAGVRHEIERQLEAFEAVWKAPPDHVDGHQHVHQFRGIREHLVDVIARRYGPESRPYLRISSALKESDLKAKIIAASGAEKLRHLAAQSLIPYSNVLSGVYNFRGGQQAYALHMRAWLQDAPDRALLLCHPGLSASAGDAIGAARIAEHGYLMSDAFGSLLLQQNIEISRGKSLYALAP